VQVSQFGSVKTVQREHFKGLALTSKKYYFEESQTQVFPIFTKLGEQRLQVKAFEQVRQPVNGVEHEIQLKDASK
jgi:hypothetical protein